MPDFERNIKYALFFFHFKQNIICNRLLRYLVSIISAACKKQNMECRNDYYTSHSHLIPHFDRFPDTKNQYPY